MQESEDEVEDYLWDEVVEDTMVEEMEEEILHGLHVSDVIRWDITHTKTARENDKDDTQNVDELMMHEIVYLNEEKIMPTKYEANDEDKNIWYVDNRASNHMTKDRRYFSKINESITGKVTFGDDSRIDIKKRINQVCRSKRRVQYYEQSLLHLGF